MFFILNHLPQAFPSIINQVSMNMHKSLSLGFIKFIYIHIYCAIVEKRSDVKGKRKSKGQFVMCIFFNLSEDTSTLRLVRGSFLFHFLFFPLLLLLTSLQMSPFCPATPSLCHHHTVVCVDVLCI